MSTAPSRRPPDLTLPNLLLPQSIGALSRRAWRGQEVLVIGMVLATIGLFIRAAPYLSHRRMFSHDNLPLISYFKISYGTFTAGRLPLWTPELNAGQPLWPVAEVAIGLDPVVSLAWVAAMAGGGSMIDVLHWVCIGWLLAFAIGVIALARRLTDDPWILTGIYAYLLLGPIWLAMPAQSYGFVLPFRYLPWVLLLVVRLIERPTKLAGAGLGIVAGFSLAGYQTVYGLPLITAFSSVYALVRVRDGLRLYRAHAWAALSTLLAFLPIALPTGIALLYASTDLYVVARTHYQGRYSFPVDVFFLDLIAPLTPSPRSWHGAFSLGPGPLCLLFLGTGALLLQKCVTRVRGLDVHEITPEARGLGCHRRALSVAWLATTAIALLLALGPATELLFLGLRNWGFVLTVALCGATQLTATAAELTRHWLEGPNARGWRALSLATALLMLSTTAVLGFSIFLEASPGIVQECTARLVCDHRGHLTGAYMAEIGFGLIPILVVLVLISISTPGGFVGRNRGRLHGVAFLMLVAWHVFVTLHAGPIGGQSLAIPAAGRTLPRAPGLDMAPPAVPRQRERVFDIRPYVPFHYEGPTVWHHAAARMLPVAFAYAPLSYPVTPITHVFRTWRYQALEAVALDPAIEDRVLAASIPPLRLATTVFRAQNLKEALAMLTRPETTATGAVVVEAGSLDMAGFVSPAADQAGVNRAGTIQVERFSGDSITLRVQAPQSALLVYVDGYDTDWSAFIEGKPAPIYPADVIGKAVPVPAGDSRVELVYRPWPYIVAFWLRAIAIVISGAVFVGIFVRRLGPWRPV